MRKKFVINITNVRTLTSYAWLLIHFFVIHYRISWFLIASRLHYNAYLFSMVMMELIY
jgi:hypothetical protein